jgi:hypothetical protein
VDLAMYDGQNERQRAPSICSVGPAMVLTGVVWQIERGIDDGDGEVAD